MQVAHLGREGSGEEPEGARQDVMSNCSRRRVTDTLPTGPVQGPQKTCLGHQGMKE